MPVLKKLLADLTSGDELRAQSAVKILAASDASIILPLMDLAASAEADHRWWAISVLGQSPHTRTDQLLPFLNDPAAEVRQAAVLGVCAHPDEGAIPALVSSLADRDSMTASLAVNALVKIGRASVPALLQLMEEAPQTVRILSLRALAEIQDHRAIPVMLKVMQEDSSLLQHWAQTGLERLGLDMVYIKP